MVTVEDIERCRRDARKAFDIHADAMGTLIRHNRELTTEMCRWMSMNVSVFDDVAIALAAGASGADEALQRHVAVEMAALRRRAPDIATTFELAMVEGLRSAILLRLARPEGATQNGRRALQALRDATSRTLVPTIVDLGMAARAKRGRVRRIAAMVGARLARSLGLPMRALPTFGTRHPDRLTANATLTPPAPRANQDEREDVGADAGRD